MSYLSNITDALLQMHIFEMAHQRKDIVDRMKNLDTQIAHHIVKVALHPDHTARPHWESEINAWLSSINNMHYNGTKKLKFDDYHIHLYEKPFEGTNFVNHIAKGITRVDDLPDHKWSSDHKQELEYRIKNVYHDICKQLATDDYQHIKHTLKQHGI